MSREFSSARAKTIRLGSSGESKEKLRERWPELVLLTGQLELIQLEDPKAAVETLSKGLRFAPVEARDFQELLVDAEKGRERKQGAPTDQLWSDLMVPIATQRYLAMAYERLGEQRLAADAWCRVRLSDMAHRTGLAWVSWSTDFCAT